MDIQMPPPPLIQPHLPHWDGHVPLDARAPLSLAPPAAVPAGVPGTQRHVMSPNGIKGIWGYLDCVKDIQVFLLMFKGISGIYKCLGYMADI